MPIYDYRCRDCSKEYDVFHRGKEVAEDIVCPGCGSKKATRLVSVPARPAGSDTGPSFPVGGGCCGGGACSMN